MSAAVARRATCRHVVVAVPARNEAATIADCLASIDRAAAALAVPVTLTLAADCCEDDTAVRARHVALRWANLSIVEGTWGRAGAARAAAVSIALAQVGSAHGCWIANTDADCRVPANWLTAQLHHARSAAAVAGIVTLDPANTPGPLMSAFRRSYLLDGDHHHHVHGANLGLWAEEYLAAGGWSTRSPVGEDRALWESVRRGGRPVAQVVASTVVTSARLRGRAHGGFAADLHRLTTGLALFAHPVPRPATRAAAA